jgi:hypothetical protein
MLQQQIKWIEHELLYLRTQVTKTTPSTDPPRTFESLRGIWEGVVFNEEDCQASRWKLPEGL